MKKSSLLSLFLLATTSFANSSTELQNSSLVIYNQNAALVHEQRTLHLTPDTKQIIYEDVAGTINTDSVNVKFPSGVKLLTQQYKYDKLTLTKLLQAHIGKQVKVKLDKKTITATLLSAEDRALVKTQDGKIFTTKTKNIIFETIPKTLITKPSLVWNIQTDNKIDAELEMDYLISNISFTSNYVLDFQGESGNLTGWFTVDNRSQKAFHNTRLSFLAGDVNFASQPQPLTYKAIRATAVMQDSVAINTPFEGYHLYTIPFKVNIANNEKTQIKFLDLQQIKATKEYIATLSNPLYLQGEIKSDVMQQIVLEPLSEPLPKGVVRIYAKQGDQTILLGEDRIKHTPKSTKITLNIGKNFDLKVTQTIISKDKQKDSIASKVLYTIKNSSDATKKVTLLVPFSKDKSAKVFSKQKFKFTKGNFATFTINVPANTTRNFVAEFEKNRVK